MIVIKGKTFADCYRLSLAHLLLEGAENEARGTKSKELLNVALEIEDPTQCLYQNYARGSQKKYIAAELIWYYLAKNDVAFISKWAKFWESIQNPDGTANSAYGKLIFGMQNPSGITQYCWALQSLINDKDTRQAVMHFNMPVHQYSGNKDFVCTMYANCHIRDNKFYMSVFMRSNDVILGTPTDVAFFCSLQMQMLAHLKEFYPDLTLGTYTHVANSYHVYDRHYELCDKMLESEFKSEQLWPIVGNLVDVDGLPSSNMITLASAIESDEDPILVFQDGNDLIKWIHKNVTKKK
jgi:thymidylate synthase